MQLKLRKPTPTRAERFGTAFGAVGQAIGTVVGSLPVRPGLGGGQRKKDSGVPTAAKVGIGLVPGLVVATLVRRKRAKAAEPQWTPPTPPSPSASPSPATAPATPAPSTVTERVKEADKGGAAITGSAPGTSEAPISATEPSSTGTAARTGSETPASGAAAEATRSGDEA